MKDMFEHSTRSIRGKIRLDIAKRVEVDEITNLETYAGEFLRNHNDIVGGDCDFYLAIAREFVTSEAAKCMKSYSREADEAMVGDEPSADSLLPGFEQMRRAYAVKRGGQRLLVPTLQLTPDEIREKIAQYKKAARGYEKHVEELEALLPIIEKATS